MIENSNLILDVILKVSQAKGWFSEDDLSKLLLKIDKKRFKNDVEYLNAMLLDWRVKGYVAAENNYYTITDKGTSYVLGMVGGLASSPDTRGEYKSFFDKTNRVIRKL